MSAAVLPLLLLLAGAPDNDAAPAAQAKLSVAASLPSSGGQRGVKQAGAPDNDAAPAGAAWLAARGRTLVLTSLRARAHPLTARIMGNEGGDSAGAPESDAAPAAPAGEDFPGQAELAAGLACWRNLELDCARQHLEQALSRFDPGRDRLYLQHVSTTLFTLAMIHVARDDLAAAEQEFYSLLLLQPDFELPPGDHPPKVGYVLAQARKRLTRRQARSVESPPRQHPAAPPAGKEARVTAPSPPATSPRRPWQAGARADLVALFGSDSEVLYPGAGASIFLARRVARHMGLGLEVSYAWHAQRRPAAALQQLSAGLTLSVTLPLGASWHVDLRTQAGVLAMGTRDRYDHWGARLGAGVVFRWPRSGNWSLGLALLPALVATADGVSFFLVTGLSGEVDW